MGSMESPMSEHLPGWERERFDRLLDRVMQALPGRLHELLEEAPLIVDDCPTAELLAEMGLDPALDDLCGLYSVIPLTERRHDASGALPETIRVFRRGIIVGAGAWEPGSRVGGRPAGGDHAVVRQTPSLILISTPT